MESYRSNRLISRIAVILVILFCSTLIIYNDQHTRAFSAAKDWHQGTLCHTHLHQEATGEAPAVDASVNQTYNRIACDMCQPGDVFCESIGEHNLARSIGYAGTNFRLERFFDKLRSGQPVVIAALGGSVSAGHGLYAEGFDLEMEGPGNMHWRIFDWITRQYPHSEHRFVNGAIPGASSELLSYCFVEQIPQNADLVLLEFAVNDFPVVNTLWDYERLLRGVLDLPSQPAVINLELVSLMFTTIGWGDTQHQSIAQWYDTPVINLNNLIMPMIFANATEVLRIFHTEGDEGEKIADTRHLSAVGHQMIANLTASYLNRVVCQMDERKRLADLGIHTRRTQGNWLAPEKLGELPKRNLMSLYEEDAPTIPRLQPQCMSTSSKTNPLKQKTQEGWVEWAWKDKPYLVGREPRQKIRIHFYTAIGQVQLFYQRSKKYGLGMARCWVDENTEGGVVLDGWWDHSESTPQSWPIAANLPAGDHVLTCEVLERTSDPAGGHEFRITTVVAV